MLSPTFGIRFPRIGRGGELETRSTGIRNFLHLQQNVNGKRVPVDALDTGLQTLSIVAANVIR
jgi:hypothetical protein